MDIRATAAVKAALNKAKICGKPIARYDIVAHRAYIENADTLFMRSFPFLQAVAFVDIILPETLDKFNIHNYNYDRKSYTF